MTHRFGSGQVVIPKRLRDELGLRPGVKVEFERDRDGVRVRLDSWAVMACSRARSRARFRDCFAVVTAAARDATLLTGDPELLDRDLGCRVRDLR